MLVRIHFLLVLVLVIFSLASPEQAHAMVDMKSANYSDTWIDLALPVHCSNNCILKVERTYNSRSIYNGLFGYRWCSNFETKLRVINPGQLLVTWCGSGQETVYTVLNFDAKKAIAREISQIIVGLRKRRRDLSETYIDKLMTEMKNDSFMRREFMKRLRILHRAQMFVPYYSNDRSEVIQFNGLYFIKRGVDGVVEQEFDGRGRLSAVNYGNGKWLHFKYSNNEVARITAAGGAYLNVIYNSASRRISSIEASDGQIAHYEFSGKDLSRVVDSAHVVYRYFYDDHHSLVKIEYPDNTFKRLTYEYNKDKDWVTSFQNRKGCIETYRYVMSVDDPKNHFSSFVEKRCKGQVTNLSHYEFWYSKGMLVRVDMDVNGTRTRVDYDEVGRTVRYKKNGSVSEYRYDPSGKRIYEQRNGRQIYLLSYDDHGELMRGDDQNGHLLEFEYGTNGAKAKRIGIAGVGEISARYDANGSISSVKAEPPENVLKISSVLNSFLSVAGECACAQ